MSTPSVKNIKSIFRIVFEIFSFGFVMIFNIIPHFFLIKRNKNFSNIAKRKINAFYVFIFNEMYICCYYNIIKITLINNDVLTLIIIIVVCH